MRIFRAFPAALLAASAAAHSFAQQPGTSIGPDDTPGRGVIVGQVIDPGSGRGIAGAAVAISGPPSAGLAPPGAVPSQPARSAVLTTAEGRFLFRDLRKGSYFVTATRPGYLGGAYGARRPGGGSAPIELDDGEHATDIVVPLWKWSTISGAVADEAGEPVVGVEVRAYRRAPVAGRRQFVPATIASTNDRGEYRLPNLTPGEYVVAVISSQSSVPAGVADLFRNMTPNDPTVSSVMRAFLETGARMPPLPGTSTAVQVGASVQTLGGATPPPAADEDRVFVYPTTFHPAARTLRDAAVLAISSGEDRVGVDVSLEPVRATRVSGTVIGPDGPAAYIGIRLDPGIDEIAMQPEAVTLTDSSGAFVFPSVPAGQYTLHATRIPRSAPTGAPVTIIQSGGFTISSTSPPAAPGPPPAPSDPTLWAALPLEVGRTPISGIAITLQTGSRVRGRVEFDGTTDRPDATLMQRISIVLDPDIPAAQRLNTPAPGRVEANGEFVTGGAPGGRYRIRLPVSPPGWHFKEARYESLDIASTAISLDGRDLNGVRIVFTDRPTEISGTVRGGQGSADPDATVLVFPVDGEQWESANPRTMRSVRASKTGAYKVSGLPPGEYYLAAVPDEFAIDWQDAQVLASLASDAARVTVEDGEKRMQDLRTQHRR